MFLEEQISILERFLKDHVTLKTKVMMLKSQLWSQNNILHYKAVNLNWLMRLRTLKH